jgi:hypothetical protein
MKANIIKACLGILLLLISMTACEENGERLYLSDLRENELTATKSDVILSQETSNEIVLSLVWDISTVAISNSDMAAPNVISTYIQISTQNDFTSNVSETLEKNLSRAYTGAELNTLAKNLGLTPDVSTPLYFRIRSSIGNNMESVYSNVATVNITAYSIDMTVGFVLNSDKIDTGRTLFSPQANGIYTGFMGASGWQNFFLLEGDGTIWGNVAVDGSPFVISSETGCWNFWFPGQSGCYYVNVNTNNKIWSALMLPVLTVSGDLSAEMTFDRLNVKWTTAFSATSASTLKIKLNADGKLYDSTTGTDDNSAISKSIAFAQEGETLILASQAGDITVNVPTAGEYTLVVDLSNPNTWIYQVVSGATELVEPIEVNPNVYLPGIDDGISGSWTFNNYLKLYNEEALAYAGVANVDSEWGYTINLEKENWDDKYAFGEGDPYTGTLVFQSSTNIPAPTPGVYLIDVSDIILSIAT